MRSTPRTAASYGEYLVVTATTPLQWAGAEDPEEDPRPQGGYVVFALPE